MNNSIKIGIVILPPLEIKRLVVQLNNKLSGPKKVSDLIFDKTHIPHLSLIHSYIKQGDIKKVESIIGQEIKEFTVLELETKEIREDVWKGIKYVSLMVGKTNGLYSLHKKFADIMVQYESKYSTFRGSSCYENYKPHFTIAANIGQTNLQCQTRTFRVSRVAFCEISEHGYRRKVIKEWKLK
jgi:hypothetical protein